MSNSNGIIGIIVIGVFFIIIGAKVYDHEKSHIKPIVDKVKGWFKNKDDLNSINSTDPWDNDLEFRGQTK